MASSSPRPDPVAGPAPDPAPLAPAAGPAPGPGGDGLLDELRRSLEAAMAETEEARARAEAADRRVAAAEAELRRRDAETARLTALLLEAEARAFRPVARAREAASAAQQAARALRGRLGGGLLRSPFATRRRMEEIRRSGAFDADYYLRANLDVALSGMDPLRHFVLHGEREGRRPNGGPVGIEPPSPAAPGR